MVPEVKNMSMGSLPQAVSSVRSNTSLCFFNLGVEIEPALACTVCHHQNSTVPKFLAGAQGFICDRPSGVQTSARTPAALKR